MLATSEVVVGHAKAGKLLSAPDDPVIFTVGSSSCNNEYSTIPEPLTGVLA
jgi:hypothetical protein